MTTFTPAEIAACRRLVEMGLEEDVGVGDLTCQAVIPESRQGRAVFVVRGAGIVAGLPAAALVFAALDLRVRFEPLLSDGSAVQTGGRLASVSGPMRSILTGERLALNFLQRLSGVATLTRRYVDAIAGLPGRILDTRKTTPGWRLLEKYAVRCGGGHNHRMGLYDGILIKDNHLAAMPISDWALRIEDAVRRGHAACGARPVEIEVENLDQFVIALDGIRPVIILLDNMSLEQLRDAVARRNAECDSESERQQVLLEASGGVTLQTVRAIAETGVDRISVGALTHSAPALDIALDYQHGR
jgi:nicotinate-nucleotide pyrophosphorylase (carboxylating)